MGVEGQALAAIVDACYTGGERHNQHQGHPQLCRHCQTVLALQWNDLQDVSRKMTLSFILGNN